MEKMQISRFQWRPTQTPKQNNKSVQIKFGDCQKKKKDKQIQIQTQKKRARKYNIYCKIFRLLFTLNTNEKIYLTTI